jgi:hypothetical protein
MDKISAHQRLIGLNWVIFLHDTDLILRQKLILRFACQLDFKARTLQPEKSQIVAKHPTYVVMVRPEFMSKPLENQCTRVA